MTEEIKSGRQKQAVNYPLRFRSKAEKAKIERAAKAVRRSLRDFILDVANEQADKIIRAGIDLNRSIPKDLEKAG